MDHKTFQTHLIKADEQQGIVEAIVAVMGNDDLGDDVIQPGAFTKTIQERMSKIRVLDQHQTDSVMRAVGRPVEIREIGRDQLPAELLQRYPQATGGLYTKTQYLMDTPEGRGVFARIAANAIDEYSIGYDPLDTDYTTMTGSDGKKKTVRNLRTVKLYEYSPVLWGMNQATQTLGFKGATGASDLPLADRGRAWDSSGAEGRVRAWADATDAPNAKYRQAFFWYDDSAPDNFTSYKLQFADVVDGKLTAIPRGLFAVAAVLQGSRGGVDLPAGDVGAVKDRVGAYYRRMAKEFDDASIVAPWDSKSAKPSSEKPWNVFKEGDKWNVYKVDADGNPTGDRLGSFDTETEARAQVRALYASENSKSFKSVDLTSYVQEVSEAFNEQFGNMMGMMTVGEHFLEIWRVYDDHLIVCDMMCDDYFSVDYTYNAASGEFVFANKPDWVEGDLQFVPETMAGGEMKRRGARSATSPDLVKAGRVMAQRNVDRIMSAMQSLMAALSDAGISMDGMSDGSGDTNKDTTAQAGQPPQQRTAPTTEATVKSIEIELEQIQLQTV